jgi:hypothetical protein
LRQTSTAAKRKKSSVTLEDTQKALEAAIEAAEQLAIYYEHRAKQPHRAAELTAHAIAELRTAQREGGIAVARAHKIDGRLTRRLSRLDRRCAPGTTADMLRSGNVL